LEANVMSVPAQPFPLPRKLPPRLATVLRYWKTLIRAENMMPFSDDVSLSSLERLSAHLLLIDVFSGPQRFRFNHLGKSIIAKLGSSPTGQFADELKLSEPLNYVIAQASATAEGGAPTLYCSTRKKTPRSGYSRILLPAWGNGRVDLLIGAIV
jgi:hypothetical protein